MAPIPTVTYATLRDYTALPAIREICSSGTTKFWVTALLIYDGSALLEESSRLGREVCTAATKLCKGTEWG